MALPGATLASAKALVFEGGIPWSEDLPNLLGIFGNKRFNSNPVDEFQRHPPFHSPYSNKFSTPDDQDWPCDEMDITKGEVLCQETKPHAPYFTCSLRFSVNLFILAESHIYQA